MRDDSHATQPREIVELRHGWSLAHDPVSGHDYYAHRETGAVQWEKPTILEDTSAVEPPVQVGNGWVRILDRASGSYYYAHPETQRVQWERPEFGTSPKKNARDEDDDEVESAPHSTWSAEIDDDDAWAKLQEKQLKRWAKAASGEAFALLQRISRCDAHDRLNNNGLPANNDGTKQRARSQPAADERCWVIKTKHPSERGIVTEPNASRGMLYAYNTTSNLAPNQHFT
ncbi:hypothetical protein CTAYLR_000044 [Chrysophaeum taylorii]|uniref:WW domain-containing protein n=1 Tax=Chrysophaeum taylorii TaxID=2483200 RepID=A0AAD7UI00_9STRA|nr:hypothetical protein CTAYLR_000044 [Chrysophaeum taylorii]